METNRSAWLQTRFPRPLKLPSFQENPDGITRLRDLNQHAVQHSPHCCHENPRLQVSPAARGRKAALRLDGQVGPWDDPIHAEVSMGAVDPDDGRSEVQEAHRWVARKPNRRLRRRSEETTCLPRPKCVMHGGSVKWALGERS